MFHRYIILRMASVSVGRPIASRNFGLSGRSSVAAKAIATMLLLNMM